MIILHCKNIKKKEDFDRKFKDVKGAIAFIGSIYYSNNILVDSFTADTDKETNAIRRCGIASFY